METLEQAKAQTWSRKARTEYLSLDIPGTIKQHQKGNIPVHRGKGRNGNKLRRVSLLSKEKPEIVFTSIEHLINEYLHDIDGRESMGIGLD